MGCNQRCKKKSKRTTKRIRERKPEVLQGILGPLKGPIQTTPRAELQSIVLVLKHAVPPICIATDHKNHVMAYKRGRKYCLKVANPLVDLWHQL